MRLTIVLVIAIGAAAIIGRVERHSSGPEGSVRFLCVEPYTAREGERQVWRRTIQYYSQSCWTSC
jgi:hypothetical protein